MSHTGSSSQSRHVNKSSPQGKAKARRGHKLYRGRGRPRGDKHNREDNSLYGEMDENEAYRRIIQLRDDVFAGRHSHIRIPEVLTVHGAANATELGVVDLGRSDDASAIAMRKLISARDRLKREQIEEELAQGFENGRKNLDESLNFVLEEHIERILDVAWQECPPDVVGPGGYSQSGKSSGAVDSEEYEPFRDEDDAVDEGRNKDEDFYSPPSPIAESEAGMGSIQGLGMRPPSLHQHEARTSPASAYLARRRTPFEEAQPPQQISLNLIQSPIAPQPAHVPALLKKHRFESEPLPDSKRMKIEVDNGHNLTARKPTNDLAYDAERGGWNRNGRPYDPWRSVYLDHSSTDRRTQPDLQHESKLPNTGMAGTIPPNSRPNQDSSMANSSNRPGEYQVPPGYRLVKVEDSYEGAHRISPASGAPAWGDPVTMQAPASAYQYQGSGGYLAQPAPLHTPASGYQYPYAAAPAPVGTPNVLGVGSVPVHTPFLGAPGTSAAFSGNPSIAAAGTPFGTGQQQQQQRQQSGHFGTKIYGGFASNTGAPYRY